MLLVNIIYVDMTYYVYDEKVLSVYIKLLQDTLNSKIHKAHCDAHFTMILPESHSLDLIIKTLV